MYLMIHKTDYSYCAGLFDGEGCVIIEKMTFNLRTKRRRSPQYQLKLHLGMVSSFCVKKMQDIFGGSIHSRERNAVNWRCFEWYVFSDNARNALQKMLPYLILKKNQAIFAIKFQQMLNLRKKQQAHLGQNRTFLTQQEINNREYYFKRLKELKTENLIPISSKGLP